MVPTDPVGFALFFAAVLPQPVWEVIYHKPHDICAVRGSTVSINCAYKHPAIYTYLKSFWFIVTQEDPDGRRTNYDTQLPLFKKPCRSSICTLTIPNVTERNSAVYRFRFITDTYYGAFTGLPGVNLTVSSETLFTASSAYLHLLTAAPEVTTFNFFRSPGQCEEILWGPIPLQAVMRHPV